MSRPDPDPTPDGADGGDAGQRLAALLIEAQDLGETLALGDFLRRVVEVAAALGGARYGALGVLDPSDPNRLARFITHGLDAEQVAAIERPPSGHGLLGRLIRHPAPVRLPDLGAADDAVGFPPGHPPMRSFLGVPVRAGGRVFGNLYLTEKRGGGPFGAQDEQQVQALAGVAGSVIAAAQARALAQAQHQVLEAVTAIHAEAGRGSDAETALPAVTRAAAALTGGSAAVVGIGPDDDLQVRAATGESTGPWLVALGPAVREAVASGRRVELLDAEPSVDVGVESAAGEPRTTVHPVTSDAGERAALVVPGWSPTEELTAVQLAGLLDTVAVQASVVLGRAAAERDRSALTLLSDRDRIAQDLHDLVIQRIFAVGLQLQGAARAGSRSGSDAVVAERVASAVTELDATIRDIRATIFALHRRPEEGSLGEDLRELVAGYGTVLGFAPTTRVYGPLESVLDDDLQMQVLSVLREALSNVARHARASSVVVEVGIEGEGLTARVVDDGVGIDRAGRGSGLGNLRARAAARGGRLDLGTRTPHGTVLTWRVPLRAPGADADAAGDPEGSPAGE